MLEPTRNRRAPSASIPAIWQTPSSRAKGLLIATDQTRPPTWRAQQRRLIVFRYDHTSATLPTSALTDRCTAERGLTRVEASAAFRENGLDPRSSGSWAMHGYITRAGDRRYITAKGKEWLARHDAA